MTFTYGAARCRKAVLLCTDSGTSGSPFRAGALKSHCTRPKSLVLISPTHSAVERERERFLVRETKSRRWKASKKRHVKIVLKKGKFRNLRGVLSSFYLL
ncbi:hypothetical protein L1887_26920 [Cichorium endivia]|nr:hypothetical protein L1887_26920 [Cichorium endivia]